MRRVVSASVSSSSSSSSPTTSSTSSDDAALTLTLQQRKQLLIRLCAGTDRGKNASPEVAAAIEEQVCALEALNATKDPAVAPGISGKWSLLYTGATSEVAVKRAELEGVIGAAAQVDLALTSDSSPLGFNAGT